MSLEHNSLIVRVIAEINPGVPAELFARVATWVNESPGTPEARIHALEIAARHRTSRADVDSLIQRAEHFLALLLFDESVTSSTHDSSSPDVPARKMGRKSKGKEDGQA